MLERRSTITLALDEHIYLLPRPLKNADLANMIWSVLDDGPSGSGAEPSVAHAGA